jgi:hypothetical protein
VTADTTCRWGDLHGTGRRQRRGFRDVLSFPAIYQGREVSGVRLEFRGGRVVKATAQKTRPSFRRCSGPTRAPAV